MGLPLTVMMLGVILIGFWPGAVDWITNPAAASLIGAVTGHPVMGN